MLYNLYYTIGKKTPHSTTVWKRISRGRYYDRYILYHTTLQPVTCSIIVYIYIYVVE